MVMTLEEISDRFEIMDLLTDYCTAIDTSEIDSLDRIFAENARIDFSKAGGPCADLKTIKKFLKENLGNLPRQHMITNYKIQIRKDHADVRCLCYNPLELSNEPKKVAIWGLWYDDKFLRTPGGWRIVERVTQPCFSWQFEVK